ncbi:MATE efflux family protein [Clostridium argentinense CDC 2741]|uniref:Multidrug export protein MepA n=1 Tax=Clostridium argentinense CDC 2741 TaxID=1418104 RepID=A0A0C1U0X8_9CLOT|nr:MATE family efflux transporter [Clostridium argentinense]ARC86446.1 MATE family efflux transporter [Clostridium argentinense]KIE46529.1 MATE efflux family protein [Clostridium argentinense CDC 2741]NFF37906.1 MATE family efflux transporter [Clostridium argentinense]NFP49862.1 MATE family efflux transporter [Clostridium argentinense]NFP71298.1 MATE family efflux transporter [Clostridium argentinense]
MKRKNDFTKGSVPKSILSLALPMTLAQLINILYNIVDRMYIGRLPNASTLALTGIGVTFPIITIIMAFANLFGMGGAPLCSIARGRGDNEEAEKIMGNSFALLIISGIFLTLLGLIFKKPLLFLFGASDATFSYANDYISIYLLGTIFVMISLGMNSFINSQGFGRMGMMTILLGAIVNIVLDPIFIFVFNMGVKGAAFATIISQFLSSLWVLKFLTGKNTILKLKFKNFKIDLSILKRIVSLGLSTFIMALTNSTVQIICNITLQSYGGDLYVGIMTVINSIREIIMMPVSGITNGSQPVLGFNYGAKEYKRVRSGIKFMSIVCILYTTLIWLILRMFPEFFIRIFNSEPELIQKGIPSMNIYFFGFFAMSLQFAGQSTYVALGKSKQAVFFSLLRKIIIVVPLTLILPRMFNLGTTGVFLAEPISNFLGGTACYVTMLFTVWPSLKEEKNDCVNL